MSAPLPLPDNPDLDWLRKNAKRRLAALQQADPGAQLADAQLAVAREYGFASWRALKAHIDVLTEDGRLQALIKSGDVHRLAARLDRDPTLLQRRFPPYEWTMLHAAAEAGQLGVVDLMLKRGMDPDVREKGDNTTPMFWAAAAGHLDVVRRLVEAGGDVNAKGDDHELELIGWACCWEGLDLARRRAMAEFLVSRSARHHIFSALALELGDEVRRIVAADPSQLSRRMSRNESHQLPLHFAVRMNLPAMVQLLIELGADPLGVDGTGEPPAAYATNATIDAPIMERITELTLRELDSAERGRRRPHAVRLDLLAALSLGRLELAERLVEGRNAAILGGALHVMTRRGDLPAMRWLLAHGADPNALWPHWDADVSPLHLAIWGGHADAVKLLLEAGADPAIRDSKHDGDAMGWAEHFGRADIAALLR